MEDNDKNLEQFFKKKFAQNTEPAPWNTPPDEVWEGVAANLPKREKEKNRLVFIVPFLFCAFGLATAAFFYWKSCGYQEEVRSLTQQLESCASASRQNELKEKKALEIQNYEAAKIGLTNNIVPLNTQKNTQLPNKNNQKNINTVVIFDEKTIKPLNDEQNLFFTKIPSTNNGGTQNVVSKELNNGKLDASIAPISLPFIDKLALKVFPKSTSLPQINTQEIHYELTRIPPTTKPLYLGISSQFFLWNDKKTGELTTPLSELLENEQTTSTLSYGLGLEKVISKHFSATTGVYYGTRNQTSTYALNIPYTINTELQNQQGSIDNTFTHSLPSGLGNVNTVLTVNRDANSQITDNEEVNIDFAFQNVSKSLFIPLKMSFYPKKAGLGFFSSIGINTEINLQNTVKVTQAIANHTEIHTTNAVISLGNQKQSSYNLQGIADLGYQFSFSKNIHGVLNLGYNFAIINKFQSGNFKHKIDNWTLGMGVFKKF
jgi:hypothetical protein